MVTGHSINSKPDTDIIISDLNARNSLSDMIISSEEEITKFNLHCQFYKKYLFDVATPFFKKSDVLTTGYTCFDITTNKILTIELYNYYNHLKDFGFKWENDLVRYEITLTENQKQIEKNLLVCVGQRNIFKKTKQQWHMYIMEEIMKFCLEQISTCI